MLSPSFLDPPVSETRDVPAVKQAHEMDAIVPHAGHELGGPIFGTIVNDEQSSQLGCVSMSNARAGGGEGMDWGGTGRRWWDRLRPACAAVPEPDHR